jgi:sugar O-acyltransferase (sialic acid O-acetyltransferase NeuD family)
MPKSILIYGAGGAGRELAFCFSFCAEKYHDTVWKLEGFIDDTEHLCGQLVNAVPVLGGFEYLKNYSGDIAVSIAAENPIEKRKAILKIKKNENIKFPLITFPNSINGNNVEWGEGCIAVMSVTISTNIKIGDFVFINAATVIGHDVTIGDYTSLFAGIIVSGGVSIGSECVIGSGVTILPRVKIGDGSIIVAGSLVSKDIPPKVIAGGFPARVIKKIE